MKTYKRKPELVKVFSYEEVMTAGNGADNFEFEGLTIERQDISFYYVTKEGSEVCSLTESRSVVMDENGFVFSIENEELLQDFEQVN